MICDVCKKRITNYYFVLKIEQVLKSGTLSFDTWIVCPTCFSKLREFVEKGGG